MKNKSKSKVKIVVFSICVLVFLVFVFYMATEAVTRYTGKVVDNSISAEDFARCLSEKNVKMYGAYGCSHCQNQKKMFGDDFKYIAYVECDPSGENSQASLCSAKGIGGYPTWEIDGKIYPGEQDLAKLSELSGCELG